MNGADHGIDGIVLPDNPSLEPFAHFHQPVDLGFGDFVHRDSGHLRYHRRDVFLRHHGIDLPLSGGSPQPDH